MKFIRSLLLSTFCACVTWLVEAKQIEINFDHAIQKELFFNSTINDQIPFTSAFPVLDCQQLTISNTGLHLLESCLPYIDHPCFYTVDEIRKQISQSKYPLLKLYQIWQSAISILPEGLEARDHDPLYLLNYKGFCTSQQYERGFAELCHLVGIATRPTGIHTKECYDFFIDQDWRLFDPLTNQMYLAWDNTSLVSAEEIMDDPFLVLRAKTQRYAEMDITQAWQQMALFEIITPCQGEESRSSTTVQSPTVHGFNLYPKEQLMYLQRNECWNYCKITHQLNVIARQYDFVYASPCPIQAVKNASNQTILINQNTVLPGNTYVFESDTFDFDCHVNQDFNGLLDVIISAPASFFPRLQQGLNHIYLGTKDNSTSLTFLYDIKEEQVSPLKVVNDSPLFDHSLPFFDLSHDQDVPEKIWWQIGASAEFNLIPSNFEHIECYKNVVTLPPISGTFFNPDQPYFFRVKSYKNGMWSAWSEPFTFYVQKPDPVEFIDFDKVGHRQYKISWETTQNDVEYLIFGSNSLDFIPSIFCDTQINAVVDGEVVEITPVDNLVLSTRESHMIVDGSLAYYRIIAKKDGQISVPSRLIYVYDQGLNQPRDVLQMDVENTNHCILKRIEFPRHYNYPSITTSYDSLTLFDLPAHHLARSTTVGYTYNPYVPPQVWEFAKPYFLPENHPIKPKLDRMFSANRVILSPETFRKAGFTRYRPGRFSRIFASSHPHLQGYFIKGFADTETMIKEDWRKLIHRIEGAKAVRECIAKHHYGSQFKVPQKWLYPLPAEPSPPNSPHYLRKNFILVAEDMQIFDHKTNEKWYKKKMTKKRLHAFYTILQEVGLADSVFAFNVPFCKDHKMAFIDTEYHHKWPIRFFKLNRYLSSDMLEYWQKITGQP